MKSIGKDRVRVSVRQQSVLDAETRKLISAARLDKYMECGVFNHEKLAGEFDASGNRMQAIKSKVIAEAKIFKGRCPAGGTYGKRRDAALSKFKEMDKRKRLMSALVERSEHHSPDLTDAEWKSVRWEMNWLNEVCESYDEWDWKVDDTRR